MVSVAGTRCVPAVKNRGGLRKRPPPVPTLPAFAGLCPLWRFARIAWVLVSTGTTETLAAGASTWWHRRCRGLEACVRLERRRDLNVITSKRMYTVSEVAQFFGITPQAVRQRIVEGRLEASKVRVKGVAREYRISAEAIREHYELTDAEMKQSCQ